MSPSSHGLRILSHSRIFRFSPLPLISVVAFVLILFLFSKNAHSADVTLAWDPNSEEDLAGYKLFYREEVQSYNYNDPLWEGSETTCTVYNLDDTTGHCFVVRAVDTSGNESADSNEACYQPSLNVAPTADAGPDQTVDEEDTVTLDGSNSSDPDGAVVSYHWAQIKGSVVTLSEATAAQPIFTAPNVGPDGASLTFQLTVTDDGGLQSADTCIVNVSWVNVAPTADAGPDQTVDEGMTVALDGANSTDADGAIASYLWTQKAGASVTLSDSASAQPTFTAPYVGLTGEALTFQLTVTDNGGLADTDTVIINVSSVNQAPTADAGPDQATDEGMTVTLDGSNSSDPDDAIDSYLWTQTHGKPVTLSNPRAVRPTFTGPFVGGASEALDFQLTVNDQGGLSDGDSVTVTVNPSPSGPVQTIFDLEAKAGARGIRLRWGPVPDAMCYHVYRSLASGGPYTRIADCHVTDRCTYLDTHLMIGMTYYYVVRSVTGGVESLESNRVSASVRRRKR